MSAAIGGYGFISMTNILDLQGEAVLDITRPGVDGVAYHKIGERSRPVNVRTIADIFGAASVKTTMAAYKAMQGTLVTVQDDFGNSFSNVMVLNVQITRARKVETVSGGLIAGDHTIEAAWTLQATGTTA